MDCNRLLTKISNLIINWGLTSTNNVNYAHSFGDFVSLIAVPIRDNWGGDTSYVTTRSIFNNVQLTSFSWNSGSVSTKYYIAIGK